MRVAVRIYGCPDDEYQECVASFNDDPLEWDVSGVINMSAMFYVAPSFNGDIPKWDVCKLTVMHEGSCPR